MNSATGFRFPYQGWKFAALLGVIALGIALPACSLRPDNDALRPVSPSPAGTDDPHSVLVVTNRAKEGATGPYFNKKRCTSLHFANFEISVPHGHGNERNPTTFKVARGKRVDPEKHFFAIANDDFEDEESFISKLEEEVQSNGESKTVAIYVHGVYTRFAEGVLFSAQLDHKVNHHDMSVTPLLFAWPSGGKWLDYVYDKDSAAISRDALEKTIHIASRSGAEQIVILAHSMGCFLTMETLRQATIAGNPTFDGKLKAVLLASPDISMTVFQSQLEKLGSMPFEPRIGVINSHDDRLLKGASFVSRDDPRVGNTSDHKLLVNLGVDVFDLSAYKARGKLTHYKFAATPKSLRGMYGKMIDNINQGAPAGYYQVSPEGEVRDR